MTYCPLIWMFYSKIDMQRVEKVQYKNLQVVCNNYVVTYDKPLAMDNKLKIHQRHLKFLITEILNSKNKLNPSFVLKTYKEKSTPYSLRRDISILIPNANTHKYGIKQLNCVEQPTNNVKSLQAFKVLLRQNINISCTCSARKA